MVHRGSRPNARHQHPSRQYDPPIFSGLAFHVHEPRNYPPDLFNIRQCIGKIKALAGSVHRDPNNITHIVIPKEFSKTLVPIRAAPASNDTFIESAVRLHGLLYDPDGRRIHPVDSRVQIVTDEWIMDCWERGEMRDPFGLVGGEILTPEQEAIFTAERQAAILADPSMARRPPPLPVVFEPPPPPPARPVPVLAPIPTGPSSLSLSIYRRSLDPRRQNPPGGRSPPPGGSPNLDGQSPYTDEISWEEERPRTGPSSHHPTRSPRHSDTGHSTPVASSAEWRIPRGPRADAGSSRMGSGVGQAAENGDGRVHDVDDIRPTTPPRRDEVVFSPPQYNVDSPSPEIERAVVRPGADADGGAFGRSQGGNTMSYRHAQPDERLEDRNADSAPSVAAQHRSSKRAKTDSEARRPVDAREGSGTASLGLKESPIIPLVTIPSASRHSANHSLPTPPPIGPSHVQLANSKSISPAFPPTPTTTTTTAAAASSTVQTGNIFIYPTGRPVGIYLSPDVPRFISTLVRLGGGQLVSTQEATILVLPLQPGYTASAAAHVELIEIVEASTTKAIVSHDWIDECHAAQRIVTVDDWVVRRVASAAPPAALAARAQVDVELDDDVLRVLDSDFEDDVPLASFRSHPVPDKPAATKQRSNTPASAHSAEVSRETGPSRHSLTHQTSRKRLLSPLSDDLPDLPDLLSDESETPADSGSSRTVDKSTLRSKHRFIDPDSDNDDIDPSRETSDRNVDTGKEHGERRYSYKDKRRKPLPASQQRDYIAERDKVDFARQVEHLSKWDKKGDQLAYMNLLPRLGSGRSGWTHFGNTYRNLLKEAVPGLGKRHK